MGFLPASYEAPPKAGGHYFKPPKNRTTTIRILGDAIVGNEFWRTERGDNNEEIRRPVRRRMNEDIEPDETGGEPVKHFWAMPVWNYAENKVQIWEVTQRTIQDDLRSLYEAEEWGDPKRYDIKITRKGDGLDTKYDVIPLPPAPISDAILADFAEASPNLEALFHGGDPFEKSNGKPQQQQPTNAQPDNDEGLTFDLLKSRVARHLNIREDEAVERIKVTAAQHFPGKAGKDFTSADWQRVFNEINAEELADIPF